MTTNAQKEVEGPKKINNGRRGGVGMKQLYKSAFSKQSQNDDNDDDAKKTDGGMEWRFVLYCALFAAGEKERGTTVPIVVNRLGKECPSKGSGQQKKKRCKKNKTPKVPNATLFACQQAKIRGIWTDGTQYGTLNRKKNFELFKRKSFLKRSAFWILCYLK